ncbi:hypothetical protein [Brevundimonas goettingensis]|uniref:DUF998 domain-containing protein n=1 Tax=Brevundimonas goettingensis TaxID=2774190 RepID=A0A975GWH1_9CAUL|nr:hypothetical protein [Brevundimonas goettingensis]QTC91779.1 hypothetical protein IFJ75_02270 [Brevundimonas goettingensis]
MTDEINAVDRQAEDRLAGGLILGGTLAALFLMLHHPTSLHGPDDGHLMRDWSNGLVHGGMIACILILMAGASALPRRLGEQYLSVRAGAMAFNGGMIALIGAALVNGFTVPRIMAHAANPELARLQAAPFGALNQVLAFFGMVLIGAACALWAVRMLRQRSMTRVAGVLGIGVAVLSGWWLMHGHGNFSLLPAVIALTIFAVWSLIVGVQLIRGQIR